MQQQTSTTPFPGWSGPNRRQRYEPRHFPYINLGRVYLNKGMIQKALEEFGGALEINPDDHELAQLVEELKNKLQ